MVELSEQPRYGVWPYILPFAVFMLISMLEPAFPSTERDALVIDQPSTATGLQEASASPVDQYVLNERRELANRFFLIYGIKVVITTGLILFFWKSYLDQFPFSVSALSLFVGAIGVVVWVWLCQLGVESRIVSWFSSETSSGELSMRSQFNPFAQLPEAWQLYGFLAIRFFGLAIMVPVCEELLLRGLLMRYVESPDWWNVALARLSFRTMLVAPLYGFLTHPTEALAAIAWFSLVTWLVHRTGRFWDAVAAHAVTNLLLGIYVCVFAQWQLW